ncbi:hypothetical protein M8J75_007091 [Diaphorina citri]|nr:hypothetical protein M8J75_007091 [Diaphorina citri]
MLDDTVRNEAYRAAICDNPNIFAGKTVLDVGFLAILCAKAGASRVYAIEASDMAELATVTVHENDVADKVQVIQNKIENVELPEKVDIIVSEWMGFYLLHESMIDSVIFARDKFLKPEGVMTWIKQHHVHSKITAAIFEMCSNVMAVEENIDTPVNVAIEAADNWWVKESRLL